MHQLQWSTETKADQAVDLFNHEFICTQADTARTDKRAEQLQALQSQGDKHAKIAELVDCADDEVTDRFGYAEV